MLPYGNCAVFQIVQNGGELALALDQPRAAEIQPRNGIQSIYKFTSDDGLLANIFNANSGIKSSDRAHIYIGCNNGINKFYPYDFTRRGIRQAQRRLPPISSSSTAACPWTDDCCPATHHRLLALSCLRGPGRCRSALISLRSTSPRR